MSFYIQSMGTLSIPLECVDAAWQAIKELNASDDGKSGGIGPAKRIRPEDSKSLSQNPNANFAYLPWDYDVQFTSLDDFLKELGFESVERTETNLVFGDFNAKSGDEEVFMKAIAPFVPGFQDMLWVREDLVTFKFQYEDGTVTVI